MSARYDLVTETTGIEVTKEGASMIATRYEVAAQDAVGKRVLEIGCGAGLGFGLIGRSASLLVGGDYSAELLASAREHYGDRYPFIRLSAEALPFRAKAFDLVLCYEMSYYLPNADAAFAEIARVLAPGGVVRFVNANPERPDFITSPYSTHYHTADEFRGALGRAGLNVSVEGAYALEQSGSGGGGGIVSRMMIVARKVLEALHLVPRTIEGRARLKRLVFRGLRALPAELPPGFAPLGPRTPVDPGPVRFYKVIYVTGIKSGAAGT